MFDPLDTSSRKRKQQDIRVQVNQDQHTVQWSRRDKREPTDIRNADNSEKYNTRRPRDPQKETAVPQEQVLTTRERGSQRRPEGWQPSIAGALRGVECWAMTKTLWT